MAIANYTELIGVDTSRQAELCEVLFSSSEDFDSFYIDFFGRNRCLIDDLFDFRDKKLSNRDNISLDLFIQLCDNKVNREIFEQTFLQKFNQEDVSLIELAISEGRISLESIYNGFILDPQENILKSVL